MDDVRVYAFVWVIRALLLWGAIALVTRRRTPNPFVRALVWSALLVALQWLLNELTGSSTAILIIWCSAQLAVLLAHYRIGLLRAFAALVLVVAGWVGFGFALAALIGSAPTAQYVVETVTTPLVFGVWWFRSRRRAASPASR
jgi:hypothetical protein